MFSFTTDKEVRNFRLNDNFYLSLGKCEWKACEPRNDSDLWVSIIYPYPITCKIFKLKHCLLAWQSPSSLPSVHDCRPHRDVQTSLSFATPTPCASFQPNVCGYALIGVPQQGLGHHPLLSWSFRRLILPHQTPDHPAWQRCHFPAFISDCLQTVVWLTAREYSRLRP